jgi:hypothetical protein
MGKSLYSFSSLKCTNAGAPKAVPADYSSISQNGNNFVKRDSISGSSGIINVVNDFQWTTSPPGASSRQEVPRIELREKRLKTNAILAAAAYYLMSAGSSAGTIGGRLSDALQGTYFGSYVNDLFSRVGSSVNNFFGNIGGGGSASFENSILNSASQFFTNQDMSSILGTQIEGLGDSLLQPYEGLYITEDTGFKYVLPYFDDMQSMINNSFTENDEMLGPSTLLGKTISKIRSATESLARLAYFTEPGLYIERPKFYSFRRNGDTIKFSFPLINTGWSTFDDVSVNWQLAFLLSYQNLPNRRTREVIDPPVIYEVTIPGVKYIPFAYIKSLDISYLGSRRQMALTVPSTGGTSGITTIVPDAYVVTITIEGLVADSRNFLAAAIGSKQDVVTVIEYDSFNPFTTASSLFDQNFNSQR